MHVAAFIFIVCNVYSHAIFMLRTVLKFSVFQCLCTTMYTSQTEIQVPVPVDAHCDTLAMYDPCRGKNSVERWEQREERHIRNITLMFTTCTESFYSFCVTVEHAHSERLARNGHIHSGPRIRIWASYKEFQTSRSILCASPKICVQ